MFGITHAYKLTTKNFMILDNPVLQISMNLSISHTTYLVGLRRDHSMHDIACYNQYKNQNSGNFEALQQNLIF